MDDDIPYPHLISIPYPSLVHVSRADVDAWNATRNDRDPVKLPWSPRPLEDRATLISFIGGVRHGRYAGARKKLRHDCNQAGRRFCTYHMLADLKARSDALRAKGVQIALEKGFDKSKAYLFVQGAGEDTCAPPRPRPLRRRHGRPSKK